MADQPTAQQQPAMEAEEAAAPAGADLSRPRPSHNPVSKISNGSLKGTQAWNEVLIFLRRLVALDSCPSLTGGQYHGQGTRCTCLHKFRGPHGTDTLLLQMIASNVVDFGGLSNEERRRLEIQRINSAHRWMECLKYNPSANHRQCFHLSISKYTEYLDETVVSMDSMVAQDNLQAQQIEQQCCQNAFRLVYGLGSERWASSLKNAKNNTFPTHALKGRTGKNSNRKTTAQIRAEESMHEFLEAVEEEAEIPATRVVRTLAGEKLRKDEDGLTELPHYYTKRSLYGRWCYQNGYKVTVDSIGRMKREPRQDAEWEAEGSELGPNCSWSSFCDYWKNEFPLLRIRPKSEDVCGECHITAMRFKYASYRKFLASGAILPDTDASDLLDQIRAARVDFQGDGDTNSQGQSNQEEAKVEGDDEVGCIEVDADADAEDQQVAANLNGDINILEAALEHVKAAKHQRARHKSGQAKSRESKVAWQQATHQSWILPIPQLVVTAGFFRHLLSLAFTADFCQNMGIPNLGADQFGDGYYFSPLTANCFGISDETGTADHLDAYLYFEHQGGKGGNCVVSLVNKFLKENNLLNKDDPIGEMTFSFDNCAGQNKNRMVLGYFAWLVEMGYLLKANVLFLVRGHTKNACDRLFNQLKKYFRKQNIYTSEQLYEALNKPDFVDVHWMAPEEFGDWHLSIDPIFKMPNGETKKNHNFTITKNNLGKIVISAYDGEVEIEYNTTPRGMDVGSLARQVALAAFPPKQTKRGVLSPLKHNELYNKWLKFVPKEFRTDWWFKEPPSPEDVASVRTEKNAAQKRRKKAKQKD